MSVTGEKVDLLAHNRQYRFIEYIREEFFTYIARMISESDEWIKLLAALCFEDFEIDLKPMKEERFMS